VKRLPKDEALAAAGIADRCPMCALVEHEPVVATERAFAILDRFAARPGHVLIVLRRHAERIAQLPYEDYEHLQRLAWRMAGALERVLEPAHVYIAALGSAVPLATSFPHVHLHVIPLADGGEADRPAAVLTWQHGMYVFESPDEERALRDRLRDALDAE
jgi:diadenosine tetraphosphate (Ap4A) HIT family hydrolase